MAQAVECLHGKCKALSSNSSTTHTHIHKKVTEKLDMVVYSCSPSTREAEAGGSQVLGYIVRTT
jgi:hypothetical protein